MKAHARTLVLLLAAFVTSGALAQSWPARPVKIVVAYPPGGGIDILARQLAERFQAQWGQTVVVENRPGGSTIIAVDLVAKAPADGHTVLMTTDSSFSINPHLFRKLPYDAEKDFTPVTMLILLQQLLVANPVLAANSLQELIALAKAKPGTINYASYGSGSQPHLSAEMLKQVAGIDLVHIPYKGISLAVPAVMSGEVELTFSGIASSMAHLKAGRLKAFAIGGEQRSALLPDLPTFAELGYPEVVTHAWFGLFVPAGSPKGAVTRIYQDARKALDDADFRQKQLIAKGYEVIGSSPEAFAAFLKTDSAVRARAVKASGARAE